MELPHNIWPNAVGITTLWILILGMDLENVDGLFLYWVFVNMILHESRVDVVYTEFNVKNVFL